MMIAAAVGMVLSLCLIDAVRGMRRHRQHMWPGASGECVRRHGAWSVVRTVLGICLYAAVIFSMICVFGIMKRCFFWLFLLPLAVSALVKVVGGIAGLIRGDC